MTRWRPGAPGGQPGEYSTSINGFGGIRLLVEARPAPYLNGELMLGFGLTFDGVERFRTTQSIDMGGATVSRSVYVNTSANWGRWLDTFTNTTKAPVTIRVAFGGQSGQGTTGATTSAIVATSSGDAVVTPEDAWVEYATPLLASTLVGGPQVTVLGTPSPFGGAMTFAGNWLYDSFDTPLAYSGHERNFQAYVNTLTLPPRTSLASNPPLGDLSAAELCSVANFDIAAMSVPGFNHASCSARKLALVQQPPVPRQKEGEDRRQVRRRREDDAYQLVARDAMAQAKAADKAGAVIIGKTALEEYATFGHWSNDAWGQVWSVFNPSRSPLASSGGSASAVAGSFSAAAMGSQTGDSLYAPASAQSLVTLRGTDGLESGTGIQPLVWMVDFGGALTRTVSDLADILNVVTGSDPEDPATLARPSGAVPADWRTVLDVDALRGKRIGFVDAAWADVFGPPAPPFGTNGTIDAMRNALRHLVEAGATIVQMGQLATPPTPDAPPAPPAPISGFRIRAEGWRQYIDSHPELALQGLPIFTEVDVDCSQKKVLYVRADPSACAAVEPRLTPAQIQQQRDYRQITRPAGVAQWMNDANVDAVVYPGLLIGSISGV